MLLFTTHQLSFIAILKLNLVQMATLVGGFPFLEIQVVKYF
ncbi:unnamed protein product [Thelazia callipaeda]|uniref:Uncharacterized protein n=1 Tax=Thelazia callipaeda TaxID=103827 RepID=A0A0N5CTZ5_THECL|nr:unnamed protein product [Thelazia callipaeda]